jgi:hypothetical protein
LCDKAKVNKENTQGMENKSKAGRHRTTFSGKA